MTPEQLVARLRALKMTYAFANVHIVFTTDERRPVAETLRASFDLATWETSFVPSAFEAYPQGGFGRYYEGIEIKGYNRVFLRSIDETLSDFGLRDIRITVEDIAYQPNHPDWNWTQQKCTIFIGHEIAR